VLTRQSKLSLDAYIEVVVDAHNIDIINLVVVKKARSKRGRDDGFADSLIDRADGLIICGFPTLKLKGMRRRHLRHRQKDHQRRRRWFGKIAILIL
jgi:hypothetical protein